MPHGAAPSEVSIPMPVLLRSDERISELAHDLPSFVTYPGCGKTKALRREGLRALRTLNYSWGLLHPSCLSPTLMPSHGDFSSSLEEITNRKGQDVHYRGFSV